jgi:hypothetical protein
LLEEPHSVDSVVLVHFQPEHFEVAEALLEEQHSVDSVGPVHFQPENFEVAEDLVEEQHSVDLVVLVHFQLEHFEPEVQQAGHFAVLGLLVLEDSRIYGVPS